MATRVLHVDDERDILDLASYALEELGGLEVRSCQSGVEAIDIASDFDPDIVLLDVMMPGMSGTETLEWLRSDSRLTNKTYIFITAKGRDAHAELLNKDGVSGVIAKPFDPINLAGEILNLHANARAA